MNSALLEYVSNTNTFKKLATDSHKEVNALAHLSALVHLFIQRIAAREDTAHDFQVQIVI